MTCVQIPECNTTQVERTSTAIADKLFLEMCETDKEVTIYLDTEKEQQFNKYYAEAATYARRISAGNFDGKNAKYKPIFHLDPKDFSPELRADLVERVKTSKESIHSVVEDAVFKLFRARHQMIFYKYIQAQGLRWRFD